MAAPTYATDLVTITTAETTTGWDALGGGGAGLSASPDIAVQGTNCVDKQITSAEKGQVFDNGSGITPGAAEHFYIWLSCTTPGLLATQLNRGLTAVLGTTTSAYVKFHLTGSDTFELQEAFKCWPIRYVNTTKTTAPRRTLVGSPGTAPRHFGGMMSTVASVKGANFGVDAIRRGSGYFVTAGDGTTPATLAGIAANDLTSRNGILQRAGGAYLLQGKVVMGRTAAGVPTAVYWVDANVTITVTDTGHSLTNFSQLVIDAGSTIIVENLTMRALGTNNRGLLLIEATGPAVALTGWSLLGIATSTLRSTTTAPGARWIGAGQITANGASVSDAEIANYSGATDTAALHWNTATSTNGKLDRTIFTKGAGTTHALRLGVLSPLSIDLVGTKFNGYNVADNQNDSAVLLDRPTGTVTFNLSGGADQPSVKSLGASATFVVNPVTTTITVKDVVTAAAIENARVVLYDPNVVTPAAIVTDGTTGTWIGQILSHTATTLFDVRVDLRPDDWTPATAVQVVTGPAAFVSLSSSAVAFSFTSGANFPQAFRTAAQLGLTDGERAQIRCVLDTDAGTADFYVRTGYGNFLALSSDTGWTAAGTGISITPAGSRSTVTSQYAGVTAQGSWASSLIGRFYGARVYDLDNATLDYEVLGSDFTSPLTDATTQSGWTITNDGDMILLPARPTPIINALTNASGVVSDTRTWAADTAVAGRVRRSTATPLYKTAPISATISSANGLALTVQMIPDE